MTRQHGNCPPHLPCLPILEPTRPNGQVHHSHDMRQKIQYLILYTPLVVRSSKCWGAMITWPLSIRITCMPSLIRINIFHSSQEHKIRQRYVYGLRHKSYNRPPGNKGNLKQGLGFWKQLEGSYPRWLLITLNSIFQESYIKWVFKIKMACAKWYTIKRLPNIFYDENKSR